MNEFPIIQRRMLTNKVSRPALRDGSAYRLRDVRALVVHWTANTDRGANALANRNYFNLGSRPASAHYIVDDHSIVQCLPDNEVGFHVGATKYKPAGRAIMRGGKMGPNYYTVGIEMCVNADGKWPITYEYSVQLVAFLFTKLRVPPGGLYRHFDITGKDCPKMMIDEGAWAEFQHNVAVALVKMETSTLWRGEVTTNDLNVRTGPDTTHGIVGQVQKGEPVLVFETSGDWVRIEPIGWVNAKFIKRIQPNEP